jgi:hypothetical protein
MTDALIRRTNAKNDVQCDAFRLFDSGAVFEWQQCRATHKRFPFDILISETDSLHVYALRVNERTTSWGGEIGGRPIRSKYVCHRVSPVGRRMDRLRRSPRRLDTHAAAQADCCRTDRRGSEAVIGTRSTTMDRVTQLTFDLGKRIHTATNVKTAGARHAR